MQRPPGVDRPMSSSSGRRPRSAGGSTRTRRYFDSREGKRSNTADIPTHDDEDKGSTQRTVKANNDGNDDNDDKDGYEAPPPISLLEDDDNVFEWEQTKPVKPQQHQFANETELTFSSIKTLLLTGRLDISISDNNTQQTSENMLCVPVRSTLAKDSSNFSFGCGPFNLMLALYNFVAASVLSLVGTVNSCFVKSNYSINNDTQEEGDDYEAPSNKSPAGKKSNNLMRMEDRIRRDFMSTLADKSSNLATAHSRQFSDEASEQQVGKIKSITNTKIDESFWFSPGQQLVGSTNIGGNVNQEVDLIVHVKEIKFSQHPELGSEDKEALSSEANEEKEEMTTKEEKSRRKRITSERYFARLLVNGHVVGDSKVEQIELPSLTVGLDHRFNCKLLRTPSEVCIQIWRSSGFLPDSLISNCFVASQEEEDDDSICDESVLSSRPDLPDLEGDWLQFASTSNNNNNKSDSFHRRLKGSIWIASMSQVRSVKSSTPAIRLEVPPQRLLPTSLSQSRRLVRPPTVNENARQNIDPGQNLNSRHCVCLADRQAMMEFKVPNSGILFSNKSLIEEPLRHKLIKKRQRNPTSVPSPIPITELEVQNSGITQLLHDDEENFVDRDEIVVSDMINDREAVKLRHLMDIRRGIQEFNQQTRRRRRHFSEVVQDVGLFRFANDDEFELPLPPRKRSLFPSTAKRLPVVGQITQQSCSLLLTIVGGKNVPIQLNSHQHQSTPNQNIGDDEFGSSAFLEEKFDKDDDESTLVPSGVLVRLKFRGKVYQTKIAAANGSGSSCPQWKETICVPLHNNIAENGFSSTIFLQDETIDLSLFDCTSVDLRHMGGFYDDENTNSFEYRYLGHVSFPLDAVLRDEGAMNGFVHLQSPDFVVGYESPTNTMLRIHATTEPLTIVPPQGRPDFTSVESQEILSPVEEWAIPCSLSGFDGADNVLWPDYRGNSFLVSRFLTEQAPPPGLFDTSLAGCAHYVSLIPSFQSANLKALEGRDKRMVLNSQQFLNILAGTRREHAILLANFFLYLSKKKASHFAANVFLVLGFAIPEGETAWVMRQCRNTKEVVFWDAITGSSYLQTDASCPLQKICFLASKDNIYGNVEHFKKPHLLNFDLSNQRNWSPMLGNTELMATRISSLQDETLHFSLPDNHYARELQNEVYESLQNSIRSARRVATCFRTDIGTKIGQALEMLEQAKVSGQSTQSTTATEVKLLPESITSTRTVFGFTLHEPFVSVQDVLDRVEDTEIYRNNMNPRVEFAIGTRAFVYPGGVVSLWVFVCSLTPK